MNPLQKIAAMLRERGTDALVLTNDSPQNMQYATGFHGLEGYVVVTANGDGYVLTDSRYIESAQQKITPLGFTVLEPDSKTTASEMLQDYLQAKKVRTLGFLDSELSVQSYRRLRDRLSCKLEALGNGLSILRSCKTETERAAITAAQRIAERAFDDLLGKIKPGMTEQALAAELEYSMKRYGSTEPSFETILISGAKTSMPHGVPDAKQVQCGEFILVDFGAVVDGYHSDMTRTFALGSVTAEMRHVYEIVLEAQLAGINAAKTGQTCSSVHNTAHRVISEAGYGAQFGHSLGHGVGLEIHEAPSVSSVSKSTLQPGAVITVEPGIYLPGKFGVRIEDMLYMTADDAVNLTHTPKSLLIL